MLSNVLVSFAVIAVLLVSTVSAKSGFWSSEDLSNIQARVEQQALKSSSNQEIYYALQFLNHVSSKDKKAYCDNIVKAGNSATSAYDLFFALKNSEAAGCGFSSKIASTVAKSALLVSILVFIMPHIDIINLLIQFSIVNCRVEA